MISHKYKCIYIHISKCAGTSIENAFGINTNNHRPDSQDCLFGWDEKQKLWLQHATPQQLLNLKLIDRKIWDNYYKFIVYRNSWSRAYSDYIWMQNVRGITGTFEDYMNKEGAYKNILNDNKKISYAGDHLYLQKDYFFLDGRRINYNKEINFDFLQEGLEEVIEDLSLEKNFFEMKLNQQITKKRYHYSKFYDKKRKKLVEKKYKDDIEFFDFSYDERKNFFERIMANF